MHLAWVHMEKQLWSTQGSTTVSIQPDTYISQVQLCVREDFFCWPWRRCNMGEAYGVTSRSKPIISSCDRQLQNWCSAGVSCCLQFPGNTTFGVTNYCYGLYGVTEGKQAMKRSLFPSFTHACFFLCLKKHLFLAHKQALGNYKFVRLLLGNSLNVWSASIFSHIAKMSRMKRITLFRKECWLRLGNWE